jgi:hypothetical protein
MFYLSFEGNIQFIFAGPSSISNFTAGGLGPAILHKFSDRRIHTNSNTSFGLYAPQVAALCSQRSANIDSKRQARVL